MKNLKLLLLVFVFGTTTLFASEKIDDDANTEIRDQIVNLLDNVKLNTDADFQFILTFTFNSKGEIIVLNENSNKSEVKDYIRKHINHKKFQNPGVKDEIYSIPLKIKAL